jgi:rubrerythrin
VNFYGYRQYNPTNQNQTNPTMMNPNMMNPNMMNPGMMQGMDQNQMNPMMSQADMMAMGKQYNYPQNLPDALELIKQAVEGETEDRLFYEYLINNAPNEETKTVIRGIRDNEINHNKMFRQIYKQLTGQTIAPNPNVTFEQPKTFCEGLRKAITGEQNAVIKYRKILFAMQDRVLINMLTEIITDEIRHGILYNMLLTSNDCKF